MGGIEHRRIGIGIDGDDGLDMFHAGEMLHRAGNAERDIELAVGRNGARLADLMGFRQPAGIGDRTRAAEGGAEALEQELRFESYLDRSLDEDVLEMTSLFEGEISRDQVVGLLISSFH